jgi:hypothetical protein
MRDFPDMGAFADFLVESQVRVYASMQTGIEQCVAHIEKVARREFGNYQGKVGPHPAWEELAESTKEERVRLGYTENDPLLRSGELMDSSAHSVHGLDGVAGSTSPIAPYHEFGTMRIPPRPVWGPAAIRSEKYIRRTLGAAVVQGLIGGTPVHPALGYDREIHPEPGSLAEKLIEG